MIWDIEESSGIDIATEAILEDGHMLSGKTAAGQTNPSGKGIDIPPHIY